MNARPLALALICGFMPASAFAASFDCAKATTPSDKFICSDSFLSRKDDELASIYRTVLAIAAAEKAGLRQSQRDWLRQLHKKCPVTSGGDRRQTRTCIAVSYEERRKSLLTQWQQIAFQNGAEFRAGPYTFKMLEFHYREDAYIDADGSRVEGKVAEEFKSTISYPLIVAPVSASTEAWNALIAPTENSFGGDCGGSAGEFNLSKKVVLVSPEIISVAVDEGDFCAGAAHGNGSHSVTSYVMRPTPRPISADDLFAAGKPWMDFLTKRCTESLSSQLHRPIDPSQVQRIVAQIGRWEVTPDSLVIRFGMYSVGPRVDGEHQVSVPWNDLHDLLAPNAPVPTKDAYFAR